MDTERSSQASACIPFSSRVVVPCAVFMCLCFCCVVNAPAVPCRFAFICLSFCVGVNSSVLLFWFAFIGWSLPCHAVTSDLASVMPCSLAARHHLLPDLVRATTGYAARAGAGAH